MHTRFKSTILALCAASMLLTAPAVATAAPFDTSDSVYEVQLWPEGDPGLAFVIVALTIPDDTPLPATVRLPFPDEAQIQWAGEVFGGEMIADAPRPANHVEGVGGPSLEITLEETYTVQYDAIYRAMDVDNEVFSVMLDWIQTEPAAEVSFAIKVPPGVEDIVVEPDTPGSPQTSLLGETLFTLAPQPLQPGDATQVSVSYSRPELAGGTQEFPILLVLVVAVVIAVVALLIVLAVQSSKARARNEDE